MSKSTKIGNIHRNSSDFFLLLLLCTVLIFSVFVIGGVNIFVGTSRAATPASFVPR